MTTAVKLIQAAYREGNLIAVGKQPTTDEVSEALEALNRFVNGIFGYEMGENLFDWLYPVPQRTAPVNANWPQAPGVGPGIAGALGTCGNFTPYPPNNVRIVWGLRTGTIYAPQAPEPGTRLGFVQGSGAGDSGTAGQILTIDGNGRQIQDPLDKQFKNSITLTAPANPAQWFYREDLGMWVLCVDMILTDESPFPKECDDFFICALSKRLAPRYGKITANETIETASITLKRLKARYRQTAPTVYGSQDFPNTLESYQSGRWWM